MKSLGIFTLLLVFSSLVTAQISVNNSSFPGVGAELKYFLVSNPNPNINQGAAGADVTYDFNALSGGTRFSEKYQAVGQGKFKDSFPDANILIINSLQAGEQYGKVLNSRVEIVGFGGENPILGGETAIAYKKRPQVRRSPMYYETTGFSEGNFALAFSTAIIPDTLLNSFPIKPDSLRISISSVTYDTIDGWGKLMLKNKEFEVLREKSVVFGTNTIEVKLPFVGWLDVSTIIGNNIPGGTGFEGFGKDTTTYYRFYTNTRKDVLVTIETDNRNRVNSIEYADVNATSTQEADVLNATNVVFPNPVNDMVTLRNPVLTPGHYQVSVLDMDGKIIERSIQSISVVGEISSEVSHLKTGMYFLVIDAENMAFTLNAPFVISR